MPDIAVAAVPVDALDYRLDGVYLVRAHHQQFLFACHEHHVAADHLAQGALGQKGVGEAVQAGDLPVAPVRVLVQRQVAFVGVEAEELAVVVGEVPCIAAVADDEELHEAEQRFPVAVSGVVLVLDDLLHRLARTDRQRLQLDLRHRNAVDQQCHVVAVMAVIGVDAQLVDDLEIVLAPVFDVDQRVLERRAVVALEGVALPQTAGGGEDVRGDDVLKQSAEFVIGEVHAVQSLEVFAEVPFQRRAVADVLAVGVFEVDQFFYQKVFDLLLDHCQPPALSDSVSRLNRRAIPRDMVFLEFWCAKAKRTPEFFYIFFPI